MGKNEKDLPRWAKIPLFLIFAGIIIWAIVPGEVLYISLGIALAVIGGVSYLVYRKWGIQPFKTLAKGTYKWLTESRKQANSDKAPRLSEDEKARLKQRVGYRCEQPHCRIESPLQVHHIKPIADGGTNDWHNLIVLCPTHHTMAGKGDYNRADLKLWIKWRVRRRFRRDIKWNH